MKIEKMRTAGAVLIFLGLSFLQYQQQAQGYEELFIGFFPEEHEQQQEDQQVTGVQVP